MATRIGLRKAIGTMSTGTGRAFLSHRGPSQTMVAANDHLDVNDIVALRAAALLEQLLAMRLELAKGVVPRADRGVLTGHDLDYMRVQLDAAIASTRGIAAMRGAAPVSIVRQCDFWRSEELPATKA